MLQALRFAIIKSSKFSIKRVSAALQERRRFIQKETSQASKASSTENTELNDILKMMSKLLHWAAIIDSSDDAIISKSIDGYITSWNKSAQAMYGYAPEEIIGKPVSVLMPPEKENDFSMIMNRLLQGEKVEHYETKRLTKAGDIIDVSITVSPIRDSRGNIIGASKIARDISERIENEKKRREFISVVSHELKTPVTSQKIYGEHLEKLINKNDDTKYSTYIKKMNQQTDKLSRLINDLLELSRMDTSKFLIKKRKFSADKLVKQIADEMDMISKHKVVLRGSTGKKVWGDRERIGQVLTNLLSNAIKYSPNSDKVVVTSEVKGKMVHISVQDFGIGIPKKHQENVFDQFFRVSGETDRTFPGMGIGLNICQEIVSRHDGELWVESEPQKGSTFYFSLPIANNVDNKSDKSK